MNLVKKGALTEQCFPYTAQDGETIDECLDEKKNVPMRKLNSKNIRQKIFILQLIIMTMKDFMILLR